MRAGPSVPQLPVQRVREVCVGRGPCAEEPRAALLHPAIEVGDPATLTGVTAQLALVGLAAGSAQPSSPAPSLAAGAARLQANDPVGVARILEQLVSQERANGGAWRLLGAAQHRRKAFDRAIEAWRRALDVEPAMPMPYYNVGVAYAAKGDADQAFEWLAKATSSVSTLRAWATSITTASRI